MVIVGFVRLYIALYSNAQFPDVTPGYGSQGVHG